MRSADAAVVTRDAAHGLAEQLARQPLTVIAAGKAGTAMANGLAEGAPQTIARGLVVTPERTVSLAEPFRHLTASHPVPDARSEAAGRAALALAADVPDGGLLVALISGGASALLAVPVEGVSLADKQSATATLLRNGADITSLNTVRKHLSALKGGQLATACPGHVLGWLLSDVVGDDPSVIGSGPTVGDPSTFAEALAVLERHGGAAAFPSSVVQHLQRGARGLEPETPKPRAPALANVTTAVIGSARLCLAGAAQHAAALGYQVVVREAPVIGEARAAAADHARFVEATLSRHAVRTCVLSAGETTVAVRGTGRGGRNQEFALALAQALDIPRAWAATSAGTDGVDGPTDAAGATVGPDTIARGRAAGFDPAAVLDSNDSWTFFKALGDHVRTGPTGTNVGDIQVLVADASA